MRTGTTAVVVNDKGKWKGQEMEELGKKRTVVVRRPQGSAVNCNEKHGEQGEWSPHKALLLPVNVLNDSVQYAHVNCWVRNLRKKKAEA